VEVTSGRWWWKRRFGVLGEGLGEKKEAKMGVLHYGTYL